MASMAPLTTSQGCLRVWCNEMRSKKGEKYEELMKKNSAEQMKEKKGGGLKG